MANVIKHKRGSGSDPSASDLILGELAIRTDTGKLFTKMDSGAIAEIAGGGSDIAINTLSSSSGTGGGSATFNGSAYRFTLSAPPNVSAAQLLVSINGVIQKPVAGTGQPSEGFSVDGTDIILGDAPATGSDFFILTFKSLGVSEPADNSVTSAKIVDGAIVNADINASAAIAGTKISPDFGSQNIVTTGRVDAADVQVAGTVFHEGDTDTKLEFGNNQMILKTGSINRFEVNNFHLMIRSGFPLGFSSTSGSSPNIKSGNTNNQHLLFTVDSTERFEVNNTGVDVTGAITADDLRTDNSQTFYLTTANDFRFRHIGGTERMRIDSSGRVGIGCTPTAQFDHNLIQIGNQATLGANAALSTTGQTFLTHNLYYDTGGTLQVFNTSNANQGAIIQIREGYFAFSNSPQTTGTPTVTERFRIDSSGRVGIGTTSPSSKLHINCGSDNTAVQINSTDAGSFYQAIDNTGESIFGHSGANAIISVDPGASVSSSAIVFQVDGNSEKMRIDSSGNVGINESSNINGRLHVQHDALAENILYATRYNQQSTDKPIFAVTEAQMTNFPDSGTVIGNHNRDIFIGPVFQDTGVVDTSAITKGICLRSAGDIGIGITNPDKTLHVVNTANHAHSPCFIKANGANNVRVLGLQSLRAATSSGIGGEFIAFFNAASTKIGSVSGENSTSYNTTSDYRLKENVIPISDGITRLKTLKPSRFNWKTNPGTTVDGFLAHEVTAVPEAITGTKDQVATSDDVNDEIKEGDPIYQEIDQSKLVPLLVAALQEAIGRIEALEAK